MRSYPQPEFSLARRGVLAFAVGLASWWVWPHARRAAVAWRAIVDGVSVQNVLSGDLAVDDEFARAAFAEFARISPEADGGQLRLHLVRPASREGWNGANERPWLLNEFADLRPWRSISYFSSDIRITEAYADFLEQLQFEGNADEQQGKEIERLRREFNQALKTTFYAFSVSSFPAVIYMDVVPSLSNYIQQRGTL